MGYPGQNPQDAAVQQRDAESEERDREAYERYKAAHPEPAENAAPEEPAEPEKRDDEFSHYLQLANGDVVKHDAADGPLPSSVNGVPVVNSYPAAVGGPT